MWGLYINVAYNLCCLFTAIQARAPHRSVECDTSLEFPLDFVTTNCTPVKRFRYDPCSYPADDSNSCNNETESSTAADRYLNGQNNILFHVAFFCIKEREHQVDDLSALLRPESYQEPLESEPEEESVESETVTIKVEPEEYEEPLS